MENSSITCKSILSYKIAFALASILLPLKCLTAEKTFELTNSIGWPRSNAPVVIERETIHMDEGQTVTEVLISGGFHPHSVPFQLDDLDGDGEWDELYFQVAIQAKQHLSAVIKVGLENEAPQFKQQTDAMADANARPDRTKPAWESESMTYASYGAAQVDAMGKIVPQLSIDFMYREPTSSQHKLTFEHGKDFMQVINTMGAHAPFVQEPDGTIARPWSTDAYTVKGPLESDAVHTSKVISAGPIRSIVETKITNWSTDLGAYGCTIRYSIGAGQKHTEVRVIYDTLPESSEQLILGAGTRAFPSDLYLQETTDRIVVASRNVHERRTLIPWLGRAIFAADDTTIEPLRIPDGAAPDGIAVSGPNYGALFPQNKREVEYAFVAAWSLDGTITSWPQFKEWIDRLQKELSYPIIARPKTHK